MKVIIIEGLQTDKCMNDCYHYLIKLYRKEIQGDSNISWNKRSRDRASTARSRPV
ncbi:MULTISPECIES: hypothetical protein [Bacillus]|uniref:hypothetical protein n=1 Tax=Bacillus TaxID=1386 RepID=UPI0009B0EB8E|nr:hypothetical protein [Bacillus subtilis]MBR0007861.1 hypothetical protein [Bacillus subtilis]MBU8590913.1 hypothetical protein [Bacillus subtilis]MBY0126198.1 hypothetical protein [Bacillus subtilis]MCA1172860.1 hypothetical protein [Bacillus subtilis]MCM3057061.1 hypothetical protein [Bacillus subtilis]